MLAKSVHAKLTTQLFDSASFLLFVNYVIVEDLLTKWYLGPKF